VVLFLHGAGESGTDNRLQLTGQTGELVFASETNQLKYPSFMVAPQCLLNGAWADSIRRAQVLGLMKALQSEFNIDSNRLYITGLSLGGIGSWDYISQSPGMYAAAIPMSGNGDTSRAASISQVPIWDFHAANDGTVNVSGSRTMIGAIRRAGGNPIYNRVCRWRARDLDSRLQHADFDGLGLRAEKGSGSNERALSEDQRSDDSTSVRFDQYCEREPGRNRVGWAWNRRPGHLDQLPGKCPERNRNRHLELGGHE